MRYIIFVFKSSESGVYFIFIVHLNSNIKFSLVYFPGGVVVKTLLFHCKGHRFDPWLGIKSLHALGCGGKKILP